MRKEINPLLDKVDDKMIVINQYTDALDPNKTYITYNPTANFTVGLKLTFASGTVTVDWKDGSAPENFTSTVTLTHQYVTAGTYRAELSGSLSNITRFEHNNNNRITNIQNLKTGSLANITLTTQLMTDETLDLTNAQLANNAVVLLNGLGIDYIKFASSNGTACFTLRLYGNDIKTLDLSNVALGNDINFSGNADLSSITFKSTGNTILAGLLLHQCNLGSLDLSNVPIGGTNGMFYFYSNPNLTNITFKSSGNGLLKDFRAYSCDLGYINLASGGMSLAANNCSIQLQDNAMGVADVNHILVDLYSLVSGEPGGGSYTGRTINIGGTNDAPDNSSGGYDGLTAKSNLEGKGFTVTV